MIRVREIRLRPKEGGGWEEAAGAFLPVETLDDAVAYLRANLPAAGFVKTEDLRGQVEGTVYRWIEGGRRAYSILRLVPINMSAEGRITVRCVDCGKIHESVEFPANGLPAADLEDFTFPKCRGCGSQSLRAFLDTRPVDCLVENHGTIFLFRPQTERARRWLVEHVQADAQYYGGALVVEHRYAAELAEGMGQELVVR